MKKLLLLVSFGLFSHVSFASKLCSRTSDEIKSFLFQNKSRVAFRNKGGFVNGGVCWWHSRLQRSSAYLANYEPKQNPPTPMELQKILHSLRVMDEAVTIPGYSDFESFSRDYEEETQLMLNDWQRRDGFFNFAWIRGISGYSKLSPLKMKKRMDIVYHYYVRSPAPLWIMAQIKGVTSHALLVLKMAKKTTGYDLTVIDSNDPLKNVFIQYNIGDNSLRAWGERYSFVPYVGFQNDFIKITKALKEECQEEGFNPVFENVEAGEVERN